MRDPSQTVLVRAALLAGIVFGLGTRGVRAQTPPRSTAPAPMAPAAGRHLAETSDFWREVRRPGARRADELVRQAERITRRAAAQRSEHLRAAYLENAIVRLERARELVPDDPAVLFELARLLSLFERPGAGGGPPERRTADAIAAYEALLAVDAEYLPGVAEQSLALLYGRQGDRERAIILYGVCVERCPSVALRANSAGNRAEELMLAGRLVEALESYRLAATLGRRIRSRRTEQLAYFGLALCRDRLGEHADALDEAARALAMDTGLEVLVSPGVFFEPASELRAYQGLGHLAAARLSEGRARRRHLRDAVQAWRAYLRLAPEEDPWRGLAAQHLVEARDALAEAEAEHGRDAP